MRHAMPLLLVILAAVAMASPAIAADQEPNAACLSAADRIMTAVEAEAAAEGRTLEKSVQTKSGRAAFVRQEALKLQNAGTIDCGVILMLPDSAMKTLAHKLATQN